MGMDPSNPHHQVMVTTSSSLEDVLMINSSSKPQLQQQQLQSAEKKASSSVLVRPTQPDLKCPRCDSSNTKFCYYNNYSLTQPRYFCKGCRRYWTQGGSLRNVPVGGGCRKSNKRPSPSSSASTSSCSSKKIPQDHQIFTINSNPSSLPPLTYDSNDLTLAFSRVLHKQQQQQQPTSTSTTMQLGFDHHHHDHQVLLGNPTTAKTTINGSTLESPDTSNENNNNNGSSGFLDALRSGFLETQSGFQNFQYGFGNCNVGDQLDNQNGGGSSIDHLPYQEITSTTTTTTRTEDYFGNNIKGERENGAAVADQSKVFVNFPWHQFSTTNGDGGNINVGSSVPVSASASGRDQLYWNNGFGSSWHGLVNSL